MHYNGCMRYAHPYEPSLVQRRARARRIMTMLKKLFPNARMMLRYTHTWELLVAVMLSAQCTDKKVNEVTVRLFQKYRTLDDYVTAGATSAGRRAFAHEIFQTGFYRQKAHHILATAKILKEKYGGHVPDSMEALQALPGVGRKTANVVFGNAYVATGARRAEGIAVDTHVRRLARVWGLTTHTDPQKIERDLCEIIPRREWFTVTYQFIEYGRAFCVARPHQHDACPITTALTRET